MEVVLEQIMPYLIELLVAVLIFILIFLNQQVRGYLKLMTTFDQRKSAFGIAVEAVRFVRQVGIKRGATDNSELKTMAMNLFIEELEALGKEADVDTADFYIEAAYDKVKNE